MLTYAVLGRKKNIKRVTRELYLRTDIGCGYGKCNVCRSSTTTCETLDGDSGCWSCPQTLSRNKHGATEYLVIDVDIARYQMDFLQLASIKNVIVLQTVLEELKNQNQKNYHQLRKLCEDESRGFYVFSNAFHKETHVEIADGESERQFIDRAIRVAVKWYQEHLLGSKISVLLLTNQQHNCQLALQEGLRASTIYEYASSRGDPLLLNAVSHAQNSSFNVMPPTVYSYEEYEEVTTQLYNRNNYFRGHFHQSQDNWLEASVLVNDASRDQVENGRILIIGRSDMNRAIEGDVVVVELLPRSMWKCPSFVFVDSSVSEERQLQLMSMYSGIKKLPVVNTGRIVAIVKRHREFYAGVIDFQDHSSSQKLDNNLACQSRDEKKNIYLFTPTNKAVPKIGVALHDAEKYRNQLLIVKIDNWKTNSAYPHGHLVRSLGPTSDAQANLMASMLQYEISVEPFPQSVLSEVEECHESVVYDENRLDLREEFVFSMDPVGCTSIDDALHVKHLNNNEYQFGVHIADVSHYVKENSAIDIEAQRRGNTVYLVENRIDMIPKKLSEGLCSLNSNVDRYAFSSIWHVDLVSSSDMKILNVSFHKSVIRSRANLSYEEAQEIIDDTSVDTDLSSSLRTLLKISRILKKRRVEDGALSLTVSEGKYEESVDGNGDNSTRRPIESISLVEEFMLLTNVQVAKQIYKFFPSCSLLRNNPPFDLEKLEYLKISANRIGVDLDLSSGKSIMESLNRLLRKGDEKEFCLILKNYRVDINSQFLDRLIRVLITRCMSQARYISSGKLNFEEYYHFGLAAPIYTHFTSPIRRYADLVVHRLLSATIKCASFPSKTNLNSIHKICSAINRCHRMATHAARDSLRNHTIFEIKEKLLAGSRFNAYIITIAANGFSLLLPKFDIEGKVHLNTDYSLVPAESWDYHYEKQILENNAMNISLCIFSTVTVQMQIGDKNDIEFRCVDPPIHQPFSSSQSHSERTINVNTTTKDLSHMSTPMKSKKKSPLNLSDESESLETKMSTTRKKRKMNAQSSGDNRDEE